MVIYLSLVRFKSGALPPPPKWACARICSKLKTAKRVYLLLIRQAKPLNTLGAVLVAAPLSA